MRTGITLPNVAFRPYNTAELAALDDLSPQVLIWLLFGGAIDQTHLSQLSPYLRKHNPRLLYRPYAGNIPLWNPADWASECYWRVTAMGIAGELIGDNERNLASENGSEDWAGQIVWLKKFAAEWRRRSTFPLHLSALSPSSNYRDGYRAYAAAGLGGCFDFIDLHIYGT